MSDMTGAPSELIWTNFSGWSIPVITMDVETAKWPEFPQPTTSPTNYSINQNDANWFRFEKCDQYDVKLIRLGATARRLIESAPTTWSDPTDDSFDQGICIDTYTAIFDYCKENYPNFKFILCPHDDDNGCGWVGDDGSAITRLSKDEIVNLWEYLTDTFSS